jgi:hypothetical protein
VSDVIYIAVMIAFFVLCTLYVQLCDRMIGPDDPAMAGTGTDAAAADLDVDNRRGTLVATTAGAGDGVSE